MIPLRWVPIDRRTYPLPRRRMERFPLERATILAMLDDDTLYGPSMAAEVGYVRGSRDYIRARRAFSYFATEQGIADSFDNVDKQPGESAAWCGSSWKWALGPRMHRVADLMDKLKALMAANPGVQFYLDGETIKTAAELSLPEPAPILPPLAPPPLPPPAPEPTSANPEPTPPAPRRRAKRLILLTALLLAAALAYVSLTEAPTYLDPPPEPGRCLTQSPEFLGHGD